MKRILSPVIRGIFIVLCFVLPGSNLLAQCPVITESDLDQTALNYCVGDVLTFTAAGTDLPAGDIIDWYISQTMGFNPYNSEGTSLGTSSITQGTCGTDAEILYLMVNPDNNQVGSDGDRCDEFIIIYTGSGGFTPNDIIISNLAGGDMWDDFVPGNTSTFNCGVALNPGQQVPANAILVIQANTFNNVTIDLGDLCTSGLPVYIIAYNTNTPLDCTGGYLDNSNMSGCASCPVVLNINGTCMYEDMFDYTPPANSVNGWGVSNLLGGGAYGDVVPDVDIPNLEEPHGIVTPFVWTIQPNFCTVFGPGTYYITGILNPAPTGGCAEIFTDEFQIHVSCPIATLTGDIVVCSANCPEDPGQVQFNISGGIGPYTLTALVTATGFPPFAIPGISFSGSGVINLCVDGVFPSYDPATMTVTVPEFLIGGQVSVELVSIVDGEGCVGVVIPPGTLVITLFDSPVANAGSDIITCAGAQILLDGSIGGAAESFEWLTAGDGQIGDPTSLQSLYIPGPVDIANGSVTITLVAFEPGGVCEPDSSSMEIIFLEGHMAEAGIDQTICNDDVVQLAGNFSGGATSATWSSGGDGVFSNILDLNATYDPGTSDSLAGEVTLYLTTNDQGGECDGAVDSMLVTLIAPPVISGPAMSTVCQGDLAFLPPVVMGDVGSLIWTTGGDGVFDDPMSAATFYTPGIQDTTNGFVVLTLTATDVLGLCDPVVFMLTLTIFDCGCSPITLLDPPGPLCNFEEGLDLSTLVLTPEPGAWSLTTLPPGSNPAVIVDVLFDAHNADPGTYIVTFILDNPLPGCPFSADIEVEVIEAPKFTAGFDLIVCGSSPVQLNGEATGSAGPIMWSSTGMGTFSDPTSLMTTYTPDSVDITVGSVMLIISGTDTVGACPIAHDTAIITLIASTAAALISNSATICNDSTLGSVLDFYSFVEGGATTGTWVNLSLIPIDISDPGNVDFSMLPPSTISFQYTSAANPPCVSIIDTLTVQVLSCACPELVVNPLPAALCNSNPGVNLDAFVMASQPGMWTLNSTPPGIMPAILVGSFLNTTGADAGMYEAMFSFQTHIDGCPDSALLEILVQQSPVVFAGNDTIICSTDDVQIQGSINSGVSSLQWSSSGDGVFDSSTLSTTYIPGPQDISNGTVQLTLTGSDTAGICPIAQSSFILTIQQQPFAIFDTSFFLVCNNPDSGSVLNFVSLITGGDASGTWVDIDASGADLSDLTQVDFDGVSAGVYDFQYTTMSAVSPCTDVMYTISIEVEECLCPDLSLVNVPAVICNNDTINLAALLNTPQMGSWQLDNVNGLPLPPVVLGEVLHVSGSSAGMYVIAFNLTNPVPGCPSSTDFLFMVEAIPSYSVVDLNCRIANAVYDAILVTDAETIVTTFGTVVQGNGDTIFIEEIPVDQNISVTLTSLSGCSTGASITAPDCDCSLEILNVPDTIRFCEGHSVFIFPNVILGPMIEEAYWITPDDTIFNEGIEIISPGTYVYFVVASNGCTASAELIAIQFSTLIPDIQFFDPLCPGGTEGSIFIQDVTGATLPLMYSVNGGTFQVIDTTIWAITTLGAGDYFLVIEDANGCQATASITLDDALGETLDLGPDIIIDIGDSVLIAPDISFIPDAFTYTPGLLDSLIGWITPTQSIVLALEAIDMRGCSYLDDILITVNQRDEIFTPNTFSPNGDQINDVWMIYAADSQARIRTLNIYDRWGGIRFSRTDAPVNDPSVGWQGTSNGKEVPPGVYVYMAVIVLSGGDVIQLAGDITVVK